MKTFEITTPALRDATDSLQRVMKDRESGAIEHDVAQDIVAAGNGVVRAVGQELKVRLAMPKIAAMEAKLVEQDEKRRLGASRFA